MYELERGAPPKALAQPAVPDLTPVLAPQQTSEQRAADEVRKRFAKRRLTVTVFGGTVTGTDLRNVATILRSELEPALTLCYGAELDSHPNAVGVLRLRMALDSSGAVSDVQATATDPSGNKAVGPNALSRTLIECAKARARALQFLAPTNGSAVIDASARFWLNPLNTIDVSY